MGFDINWLIGGNDRVYIQYCFFMDVIDNFCNKVYCTVHGSWGIRIS